MYINKYLLGITVLGVNKLIVSVIRKDSWGVQLVKEKE